MYGLIHQEVEKQRPQFFLWSPVCLGAGMGSYFLFRAEPQISIYVYLGVIGVLLVGVIALRGWLISVVIWMLLLFATGLTLANLRAERVTAPVLSEPFFGTVEGTINKLDRSQSNRLRITLENTHLYGIEPRDMPAQVRITLPSEPDAARIGSRILVYAKLEGPGAPVEPGGFDFRRWAWFKRLGGVGYALGPVMRSPNPQDATVPLKIVKTRLDLANMIRREIPGRNGAFAAAILTGDRSAVDPALLNDLRASNLAHLLAISGLHMGLLTGFIFALVRYGIALVPAFALRISAKKAGAIAAMPAGLTYLILSGASIATQRAYVMAFVILLAVVLDRPAFTLRAVALAALVILVISPESVTQVGFQMSFAATIGLVAGFEMLRRSKLWCRPVRGYKKFLKGVFSVGFSSFVAGMATAPIAAFHFNQFAQYGLVANLIAVPLMGSIVMPAAILALMVHPFGLSQPFFWIAGEGIGAILEIARIVAALDGAVRLVPSGPHYILPVFAIGALIFVLWKGWGRLAGVTGVAASFALWMVSERPLVLVNENGRLVGVLTQEGRALNRGKGEGFSARSWLENDGDAASQKVAATRLGDGMATAYDLGGVTLVTSDLEDISRLAESCASTDIIIAAKVKSAPPARCAIVDQSKLAKVGAIAIYTTGGTAQIIGSKEVAGQRLWTVQ